MTKDNLVSNRGIILQRITDQNELRVEGGNLYVDDLLDCFEQWDGSGLLRDYCIRMFGSELRHAQREVLDIPDPYHRKAIVPLALMRRRLLELVQGESEEGLIAARSHYQPDRVRRLAPDSYIDLLARAVTGKLGGKVGIAPRIFLKKLVSDVLDRIDQFDDFNPTSDYQLTISTTEMTGIERESQAESVDDIELET